MRCVIHFMLGLVAVLSIAAPDVAQAQGTIHYISGTTWYQMPGIPGSTPTQEFVIPGVFGLTDLKYPVENPDGHLYFYNQDSGGTFTWNTTTYRYGDHYAWNGATGASTKMTEFSTSLRYRTATIPNSPRWSKDGLDSFFSFAVFDFVDDQVHIVRAWVTGAELASSPTTPFLPLNDWDLDESNPYGRLEVVISLPRYMSHYWSSDGSGLYYNDDRVSGAYKLRFHPVGATPIDNDTILLDEAVTKLRTSVASVVPITNQPANGLVVVQVATKLKNGGYGDSAGLIVLDPQVSAPNNWSWLLKETTSRTGLEVIRSPLTSPDGMYVIFNAERTSNGKTVAKGIYRIPLAGGSYTAMREDSATSVSTGLRGWIW